MLKCAKLFTMLNRKDTIPYLRTLGLSRDEAKLYLELLKCPSSHLELSRATGVNRTKVYRLADQLEKRSLITTRTDDRGTVLVAADPSTLEVDIVTREEDLKNQRAVFGHVLPSLEAIQKSTDSPTNFSVQTYEGEDGFKQMLWHELKTKGENLIFGYGRIQELVTSQRWAEIHRKKSLEAGYQIREILNPGGKLPKFTKNQDFMHIYYERYIPEDVLLMQQQICIYNDTVAIYNWRNDQKVGIEISNKAYADMQRAIFEQYWQLAK